MAGVFDVHALRRCGSPSRFYNGATSICYTQSVHNGCTNADFPAYPFLALFSYLVSRDPDEAIRRPTPAEPASVVPALGPFLVRAAKKHAAESRRQTRESRRSRGTNLIETSLRTLQCKPPDLSLPLPRPSHGTSPRRFTQVGGEFFFQRRVREAVCFVLFVRRHRHNTVPHGS